MNKIILMSLDADFFFERAIYYLDKNKFSKALKYFWRLIDIEPNNSNHYCNIASILTEMGQFEESNDILFYVVDNLDPYLSECYYFIANNYAYLDELDLSFKYIHRYLDVEPQGEYANDANEILSYISDELDEIVDVNQEDREIYIEHYKAKGLLEEGHYIEAINILEDLLRKDESFIPARNNLAIAYYYKGAYDKAIKQSKIVLDIEKTNIYALSNLTIFYKHLGETNEYEYIISFLKKIVPYNKDYLYKLATTFAILEEDELAFKYFYKLINSEELEINLLHYGAVAAFNTDRYSLAEKWWRTIYKLDKNSEVANFYLYLTQIVINNNEKITLPPFGYQYQLPFVKLINHLKLKPKKYENNLIKNILIWGLKNGDNKLKEQIILLLTFFNNNEAEQALRNFLLDERQSLIIKQKALLALEDIGAKPPYKIIDNGKVYEKNRQTLDLNIWKENWLEILIYVEKNLSERYNLIELFDAKILWYEFISKTYPETPQIRKTEGWIAALEYIVCKMHNKQTSLSMLSDFYKVSPQTISKHVNQFEEILDIKAKINKSYSTIRY